VKVWGGTDKLSDRDEIGEGIVVVGADSLDGTTVILVLRTFFMERLLTLTKSRLHVRTESTIKVTGTAYRRSI
jgi:hypothetical protein